MKVTAPGFGLDARGTIGKAITYSIWKGINYIRRRVVPQNPNTTYQQTIRKVVKRGSQDWKNAVTGVGSVSQLAWNTAAEGTAESGFNRYMRAFIIANYNKTTHTMVTPVTFPTPA